MIQRICIAHGKGKRENLTSIMYRTLLLADQDRETMEGLEYIYDCIVKSEKIVVISGAGISCSGGIPVGFAILCIVLGSSIELNFSGLSIKEWSFLCTKSHRWIIQRLL
jgi:hypothetical protein